MKFDKTQNSYTALRDIVSERTTGIVAWVGSGLSVAAGLPTWDGLRTTLRKALENKATSMRSDERSKIEAEVKEIGALKDHWVAIGRLKSSLGDTTYRDTIRDALKSVPRTVVPATYEYLWKLRISGLINLNIDRLATKARQKHTDSVVIEFNGKRVSDFLHVLKSPKQYILNLHGEYEDLSSWIFTRAELNSLKSSPGYKEFLRTCLLTSTVLFVGISADDEAVGGHLEDLARLSKDTGPHFWLTDRRDRATDDWAEAAGVRVIRYDSRDDDHSAVDEFFNDLLTFISKDTLAPPVAPLRVPDETELVEDPIELQKKSSEDIRRVLNKRAQDILREPTEEAYSRYEEFFNKYDEAIYRAWYTSENSDLLGYALQKLHAKGAFGRVYKAISPDGNQVAIKVLLEEERKRGDFLQSFRRGVRSMQILSNRSVEGIVGYKEAYEIPSFVVMPWIEGPNLSDAVRSKLVSDWGLLIRIGRDLSRIIESAHRTPERVLHRDLRPANIMLQGYYTDRAHWNVLVLDFDLSWHLGASEKSVIGGATTTGYLAPEQIQSSTTISTRHSAVDSFGLGMTLFFMTSRRDPFPTENNHTDWAKTVIDCAKTFESSTWKSLPARFARLVINATKQKQSERWDMNQIRFELERLHDALETPNRVESAELIAEEVFARTSYKDQYEWSEDKLCAVLELPSSAKLSLSGHESRKQLRLGINWAYGGGSRLKNLFKRMGGSFEDIKQQLSSAHWIQEDRSMSGQSINFLAHLDIADARNRMDAIAKNLEGIVNSFGSLTRP